MSIRKIEVSVTNLTEPKNTDRFWAGMQYEDNATKIVFDLSSLAFPKALYRIDFNSNGAGYHPSQNLTLLNGKLERDIPKIITQYGGEAEATAVVTELDSSGSETGTVYSYPVILYFTSVEKSEFGSDTVEGNISEMEATVRDLATSTSKAATAAEISAKAAQTSKELTEEARFALENDSEFVFLGGNADGFVSAELVIDGEMSDASQNPVMNKTVKAYVDEKSSNINNVLNSINQRLDSETDYIVEQGTSDEWVYRKWNSGIAECWGKVTFNNTICSADGTGTQWGSSGLWITNNSATIKGTYPFAFSVAPTVQVTPSYSEGNLGAFWTVGSRQYAVGSGTETGQISFVVGAEQTTAVELNVAIYAIGRWK